MTSAISELVTRAHFTPPGTAPELITAVSGLFGELTVDLAASASDTKAPRWIDQERDAFTVDWTKEISDGIGWLNPPVGDIGPWVAKCAVHAARGTKILLLAQAAIDAPWYWQSVLPWASVHALYPRLQYEGIPVPLMIAAYNFAKPGEMYWWHWRSRLFVATW